MKAASPAEIERLFEAERPLRQLAENETRPLYIPETFPGGTRMFAPRMQGTLWGRPDEFTMSLLKTDVFDRRFVARKPFTVDEIVKGAFSEANKDFDDMPHSGLVRNKYGVLVEEGGRRDFEVWSQTYPFPCIKPVGQVTVRAGDLKGGTPLAGRQSLRDGTAAVQTDRDGDASMVLSCLVGMKRNVVAYDVAYEGLTEGLSFRLFRHQDQGHRRYMDENGNFIPEKDRLVVYTPADITKPLEYYDLEADADVNGPFDPPECGSDGRFFWVSQRLPAEATFPEGFAYVMMGLVSDPSATIEESKLQKGLGVCPYFPVDAQGKIIVDKEMRRYSYMHHIMQRSYDHFRNAPGTAVTATHRASGAGRVELYVSVVTTNETDDIFAEAKRQLLEAEKLGYEGLAGENKDWYDELYDRREEGRISILSGSDRSSVEKVIVHDAFRSWAIQDGGYCSPDPRKYEGCEVYAGYDLDAQAWHSLPCYNEVFSEPMMTQNRHEPYLYYCWLIEAWYEGLEGKAREIYGLPGLVLPHGYLPPAKPHPWYMENQALDLCLDVSGEILKVLWNMWDYRADEEMLRKLVYPAVRDLAIFFEAFARRNYDGRYYNLLPVVETENWGISYRLEYAQNTTGAIALFRKILNCAVEAAELLGTDEKLVPGWREVAEHLPPYPTFMVSSGEVLAGNPGAMPRWTSGDHPVFTGDYPATLADEITLDSTQEEKDLIARTNDVVRTEGDWNRNGFILVGKYKDRVPATFTTASIPIEDETTLTEELLARPERLLNSRSGRIHLFPVFPDWAEVAFRDFQARGGFLVSAARDRNGVTAVVIKARRSIPCRIVNPWAEREGVAGAIAVTDMTVGTTVEHEIDRENGECIVFDASAGHEYSVEAG